MVVLPKALVQGSLGRERLVGVGPQGPRGTVQPPLRGFTIVVADYTGTMVLCRARI